MLFIRKDNRLWFQWDRLILVINSSTLSDFENLERDLRTEESDYSGGTCYAFLPVKFALPYA